MNIIVTDLSKQPLPVREIMAEWPEVCVGFIVFSDGDVAVAIRYPVGKDITTVVKTLPDAIDYVHKSVRFKRMMDAARAKGGKE